jgi:hypothetical protein
MKMDLRLSLKTKWFEMTKTIKGEDYRLPTPYWCSKLLRWKGWGGKKLSQKQWEKMYFKGGVLDEIELKSDIHCGFVGFAPFTTTTLTLGYPSATDTDRIIQFEHAGIEIRTGNPEWGAEPDKLYFVIKHGKRIS